MRDYLIYMAGPIGGCNYDTCTRWRTQFAHWLADFNVECLCPMRGKNNLAGESDLDSKMYDTPLSCQKGVYTRDRNDALRCDLLLVNVLETAKPSLGTVMEIAWANSRGTPIILVMEPEGNPHEHLLIREACGFRAASLEEATCLAISILNLQRIR